MKINSSPYRYKIITLSTQNVAYTDVTDIANNLADKPDYIVFDKQENKWLGNNSIHIGEKENANEF
jgi:hypothetical protein